MSVLSYERCNILISSFQFWRVHILYGWAHFWAHFYAGYIAKNGSSDYIVNSSIPQSFSCNILTFPKWTLGYHNVMCTNRSLQAQFHIMQIPWNNVLHGVLDFINKRSYNSIFIIGNLGLVITWYTMVRYSISTEPSSKIILIFQNEKSKSAELKKKFDLKIFEGFY